MEIEFADPDYDRLEIDAGFTAGFSAPVVKAYRKRLQYIRAAADERDFYALKSLHFEKLKGDRDGEHSMRLNDQWRLILRLERRGGGKLVVVISIEDYH
ncbi:Plasmid maintenance system killer [Cupriavidus taiwanensis]|uniref:type II toxin-antitoxin system RelE/ParE family toxin n=1 Tax=Cupriavidus taiwanensis TaxID=164546 RepID=UPI000E176623|nr:type II toxin-antitoxin system RelE/ParE family toxin [Cupriavidus taiwanensis]SOZ14437.1 Plasmid maintenance system killer [Cupriavidus taiwanensis]SOZ25839.1 Plasmid maintenance system killer [Cupriavidus taiwanensis]SOZ45046.1 Plasmid maintenance system killer [Cupriavidus taiwanensis]